MVQECSTSFEVIIIRVGVWIGTTKWFEVSIRRFELDLIIKEEKLASLILEYWYAQFHWNPIPLIDIRGLIFSSIKYNVFKDGIAIKSNIRAGILVQNSSISWASRKNRLKFFETTEETIK